MPPTALRCWLWPDRPLERSYAYRVAGRILLIDGPLPPLVSFAVDEPVQPFAERPPALADPGEFVCRSTGWIGAMWRDVQVWRHAQGLRIRIDGVAEFAVTSDGISVTDRNAAADSANIFTEALLGPPLVLALALHGVWCMHASAVMASGRVIAFAGESGNGKSTLAAYLGAEEAGGWRRLADDTLPVALGSGGVLALPHFPQLKLPADGQYHADAPASLPLAGLCVIASQTGQDSVTLHPLEQRQAMQALIRHTVASRLFDRPLLAAHLAFCEQAAAGIPVWRIAYPHREARLPEVRDAIHRALGDVQGRGQAALRSGG